MKEMIVKNIELNKIVCDEKNNVRDANDYDSSDFKALKENIKALEKLTNPVLVKEIVQDEEYILIAGFRRFNAVKQLLEEAKTEKAKNIWKEITCSVELIEDEKKEYKLKLAENFARKDMTQEEKAEIVYKLYEDEYKPAGKGWGSIAKDIGISIAYARKLYKLHVDTMKREAEKSIQQQDLNANIDKQQFDFEMTKDITKDVFKELEIYDSNKTETAIKMVIKENLQELIEQLKIKLSEISREEDVTNVMNTKRLVAIENNRIQEYNKVIEEIDDKMKRATKEEKSKFEKEYNTILLKIEKAKERLDKLQNPA